MAGEMLMRIKKIIMEMDGETPILIKKIKVEMDGEAQIMLKKMQKKVIIKTGEIMLIQLVILIWKH